MNPLKDPPATGNKAFNAEPLLDITATHIALNYPFADLSFLPHTLKVSVNRRKSRLEFQFRYEDLRPIPEDCFYYTQNGLIDLDRTVERAERVLEPGQAFQLCCAFGLMDRLARLWNSCLGFGQDDLLHHNCFFFRYFAELTNNGRPNSFFTSKRMFKYAMEKRWDTVAVHFYRSMSVEDRRTFLIEQWLKTVYTSDEFERFLECNFLRQLVELKNFEIGNSDIEAFLRSRGFVTISPLVKLPGSCSVPEIDVFLASNSRFEEDKVTKELVSVLPRTAIFSFTDVLKSPLLNHLHCIKN